MLIAMHDFVTLDGQHGRCVREEKKRKKKKRKFTHGIFLASVPVFLVVEEMTLSHDSLESSFLFLHVTKTSESWAFPS